MTTMYDHGSYHMVVPPRVGDDLLARLQSKDIMMRGQRTSLYGMIVGEYVSKVSDARCRMSSYRKHS
jgi:hypothetical protein